MYLTARHEIANVGFTVESGARRRGAGPDRTTVTGERLTGCEGSLRCDLVFGLTGTTQRRLALVDPNLHTDLTHFGL